MGGEPPVGALAFNTLRAERDWPDALVKRLQLVAQVFANALARKRHELSLRESEERLALAADSAEAGLWTLDYGTGVFWATERARAIFGYSPDEVISMERFEASVHPDDWDLVRGAIERSARAGEPVDVEYRIVFRGDGRVRWIASRGRPASHVHRRAGAPDGRLHRRHRAEARRRGASRERGSPGGGRRPRRPRVLRGGLRQRHACTSTTGFATSAAFPRTGSRASRPCEFWMEHLHPDDRQRVLDLRQQLHDGRLERLSVEYRYLHPVRGEKWIHHLAARRQRATPPDARSGRSASSATSPSASEPRTSCAT